MLVVDDEPLARERLRRQLGDLPDLEVAGEAGNGAEALAAAERLRPDVVLLDIRMPGMDGLETARHLPAWFMATSMTAVLWKSMIWTC